MRCRRCGAEMPEGALRCEECGAEIRIVPDLQSFRADVLLHR